MDSALFDFEHLLVHKRCTVCGVALSITHTHTYVVQRQVWVKIGATSRPHKRIQELRLFAWHKYINSPRGMDWTQPLHVQAMLPVDIEHETHRLFAEYHAVGEWFWDCAPIRRWLRDITVIH